MDITISSPHLEVTPALRDFTEEKFHHLHRFDNRITAATVTFDVQRATQTAAATIRVKGGDIHAAADSADLYQSVGSLVKKLESQLKTHKEKLVDHRDKSHV